MSNIKKAIKPASYMVIVVLLLLLTALPAAASDGGNWRSIYDLIMRWINFLILAFVIVKYGRAPLKSFIKGQREDVSKKVEALQSAKADLVQQIEQYQHQLETSGTRLEELKKRIIDQGEKNRQQIIASAEHETQLMMAAAKQRLEHRIQMARQTLLDEIVDTAIELTMHRLPEHITAKDNQKYVDAFLAKASKTEFF